uniref:Protein kinase domain-containing protein n=1 Tax=Ciona intestinalis TaxID=7719 RepID=H2XZ11_CIOIN
VPPQPVWVSPSEIDLERDDRVIIGWGSFGSVLRCYYKKVGRCAVKCVRATSITDDVKTAAQRADHTNIVRVYGITSWVGSFGIIMEYMERRSLANLIQSASSKDYQIPFDLLVRILLQVANGVAFLHKIGEDKQIVHGDLKPSNIVLDNNFTAKVTDFGGATLRTYTGTNEGGRVAENVEHTPVYTAPERLVHLEYAATKASDVYSYGLIVYECLSDR